MSVVSGALPFNQRAAGFKTRICDLYRRDIAFLAEVKSVDKRY
jgi:hypothetical protein